MIPRLVAALAALPAALPCAAQDYPSRSIRIVVPYGAGVAPDVIVRIAGERLAKSRVIRESNCRTKAPLNPGRTAARVAARSAALDQNWK